MMKSGINRIINSRSINNIISFLLIGIFTISFYVEVSNGLMGVAPSNHESISSNSPGDLRLMSSSPYDLTDSSFNEETRTLASSSETGDIYTSGEAFAPQSSERFPRSVPRFDVGGSSDGHVVINRISPEAMEINATQMEFILNFTIINSPGNPSSALENLTISNATNVFRITDITNWYFSVSPLTDNYSLNFILNSTVLSDLTFGEY
ncbi:MAG: hypothetical protein ACFFFG_10190, partial [Candidatus Thorarchaeota archaeon]